LDQAQAVTCAGLRVAFTGEENLLVAPSLGTLKKVPLVKTSGDTGMTPNRATHCQEDTSAVRSRIAATIVSYLDGQQERDTTVSGLTLIQRTAPVPVTSFVYEPSLAMIMQGRKHIFLGQTTHYYDESLFFLTSVGLPTMTEVVEASEERPYVSVLLNLDMAMIRSVIAEIAIHDHYPQGGTAQAFGPADRRLFEVMERLINIAVAPCANVFLENLAKRELLYYLLTGPASQRVQQTALLGTQGNKASKAVEWLHRHYAAPLRIAELAELCSMAESSLHHRFRALTSMSPLQFQKNLRLHEARRLLLSQDIDTATAAYQVGYESVHQFNREYKRAFGAPPRADIQSVKRLGAS